MKHRKGHQENSKATRHCLKLLKTLTKQNLKVIKLAEKLIKSKRVKWENIVSNESEEVQEPSESSCNVQPNVTLSQPKRSVAMCQTRQNPRDRTPQRNQLAKTVPPPSAGTKSARKPSARLRTPTQVELLISNAYDKFLTNFLL